MIGIEEVRRRGEVSQRVILSAFFIPSGNQMGWAWGLGIDQSARMRLSIYLLFALQ